MEPQTSRGLRISLLVQVINFSVYGLLHVVSPELVGAVDPAIERVLGAAVLAFAYGGFLSYRELDWSKARMVVLVQVIWMYLYSVTMIWGLVTDAIAPMAWPPTIIVVIFAVLLTYFYLRES